MKATGFFLLLLVASVVAYADGPPLPRTFGKGAGVIRVEAERTARRQEEGVTVLDLRGGVKVYQGAAIVTAERLMAWFRESGPPLGKVGILDIYGEAGTSVAEGKERTVSEEAVFLRLTTSAGLVVRGEPLSPEDASAADKFQERAKSFRAHGPPAAAGMDPGMFGEVHPSAEEMVIEDLSDAGVTITLQGNAKIVYEDLTLSADTVRLRISFDRSAPEAGKEQETFESAELESIYAEGAVELVRGAYRITANAIILDVRVEEALARDARVRTSDRRTGVPMQFHADAIRQLSRHRFAIEGPGYFTTSQFAVPHYRIEGRNIRMVRGPGLHRRREIRESRREEGGEGEDARRPTAPESMVVSSQHNVIYLGPVPIFYWPYLVKDVRTGAFLLKSAEAGHSSRMGNFGKLAWNLYDLGICFNDWSELTLRTDYFSERGAGVGLDFSYEGDTRHGFARGYYINDTAEDDDRGLPVPQNNRGEATFRHREGPGVLPEDWRLDLELGYLSDRRFLRTYDRDEYDEAKDHETQAFLSRTSHNTMFTVQHKDRINDFQNTVERQSLAYHMIGQPVFNTPLLFTTHADLSNLQLRRDDDLGLKDPDGVARLDTPAELSLPFQLGPVRADPYVWGDATSYSDQTNGNATARWAGAYGVRAATNFHRTYASQSRLFQVDRLRHIITPTAEYLNRWKVSKGPGHFVQHDEIDALDETHRLSVGLRNRLQTYRPVRAERQPVDLAVLDVDYIARLSNTGDDRGADDYVEAGAEWSVTENLELASKDNLYNLEKDRLEAVNSELRLNYWRPVTVTLGHKYYVDTSDPDEATHSIGMLNTAYRPRFGRWRVDFDMAYDFQARRRAGDTKDPHQLGSALSFTRILEGWEVSVGARFNQGRSSETVLTFNIALPGMGGS